MASTSDEDTPDGNDDLAHENEREHPRYRTKLVGRYMLADRREFECVVVDVALGGIALSGPHKGAVSETVIAYIDQLGRVEGDIVRLVDEGFALKLTVTSRATQKLAARLDNLRAENKLEGALEEADRRQEPRIESEDQAAYFSLPLGEGSECEVLDLSRSGAEVKTENRPPIGALVQLGQMRGKVVRHTSAGVGIEFDDSPDSVSLTYRFSEISSPDGSIE